MRIRLRRNRALCASLCYIAQGAGLESFQSGAKKRVERDSHLDMSLALSIIIPAYNEAARLGRTLQSTLVYLNDYDAAAELIVVDDGSHDDTAKIAESILARSDRVAARLIRYEPNRGKGYAVRTGLLAAQAPIALFTDADLSTPLSEIPKIVAPIASGEYDLVFGSRALDRSLIGVDQPWRRKQSGRIFNLIVRLATGMPFWDTQCGFKAFRMSVCRPIIEAATVDRFGFDVELLFVAYRAGLRLLERAVRWNHNEGSKVNVARDSFRMLNEVLSIRRRARAGGYDRAIASARAQLAEELRRPTPQELSDVPQELSSSRI
jgi:dolichyl-phosphate beta-glucosyltransferase